MWSGNRRDCSILSLEPIPLRLGHEASGVRVVMRAGELMAHRTSQSRHLSCQVRRK